MKGKEHNRKEGNTMSTPALELIGKFESIGDYKFPERRTRHVYDWDKFLDGKVYEARRGVHFKCTVVTMAANIKNAARQREIDLNLVEIDNPKDDKDLLIFCVHRPVARTKKAA